LSVQFGLYQTTDLKIWIEEIGAENYAKLIDAVGWQTFLITAKKLILSIQNV
jgi:hypothetical protein